MKMVDIMTEENTLAWIFILFSMYYIVCCRRAGCCRRLQNVSFSVLPVGWMLSESWHKKLLLVLSIDFSALPPCEEFVPPLMDFSNHVSSCVCKRRWQVVVCLNPGSIPEQNYIKNNENLGWKEKLVKVGKLSETRFLIKF